MKTRTFIAAVAALGLSTVAFTADTASAAKIIPIQGKYSKIKLDGICAANGGSSYGTADTAYGCSKGYVFMQAAGSGMNTAHNPQAVLQQWQAPSSHIKLNNTIGGTLTAQ